LGTTPAYFRAGGKYCLRRTALNTFVRKVIARFGRCLRTLFGTPFGPGALSTLSPLMACKTSEGAVNAGPLAVHTCMGASSHQPSQLMPGPTGRPPAGTELQGCRPGLPPSWCQRARRPGTCKGGDGVGTRHHPLCHLPQQLVLAVQGFQRMPPLIVPPPIQPIGHRPLEAVEPGFQSGVPCDLPLPSQRILQAYFILNTNG
jgi:hypothetical protein